MNNNGGSWNTFFQDFLHIAFCYIHDFLWTLKMTCCLVFRSSWKRCFFAVSYKWCHIIVCPFLKRGSLCSWWRRQMETFTTILVLCEGNPPVTGGFPSQRPVTRSFDVFFGLHLNKRLSKQSRRRWFETPVIWGAHYDVTVMCWVIGRYFTVSV